MRWPQIRALLRKKRGTLFFTASDRALLALLEQESYAKDPGAIIDADYTRGCVLTERRVRRILEEAWNDDEP